ncbi:MAG: tyrosine-type recombinase/integrase [Methanoculleus marisnigri]|nr:tyrosine-type recombinase/integrase [Methanoculleus marisnigri]
MPQPNRPFYNGQTRYGYQVSLESGIESGIITDRDRKLILEYVEERKVTKDLSLARINKIVSHLVGWRKFLTVPFSEATITDIYAAITALKGGVSIKGKPFSQNTIHDYIRVLKPFLHWLNEEGYKNLNPTKIRKIQSPPVDRDTKSSDDLLTVKEVEQLLDASKDLRNRAIIGVLYESGCRIGELGRLQWKDVIFDEYGVKLYLTDNKTKKRRYSRLTLAASYLAAWKVEYPGSPSGDNLVFISQQHNRLEYNAFLRMLQRTGKAAGLTKHIHPHILRSSRITHMVSQNYQESVIKKSMWGNLKTDMFETYVKLGEGDIDAEFLEKAGVAMKKDTADELKARPCPNCHTTNAPTFDHCYRCGWALSSEAIARTSDLKEQIETLDVYQMLEAMRDRPELFDSLLANFDQLLLERLKTMGLGTAGAGQ